MNRTEPLSGQSRIRDQAVRICLALLTCLLFCPVEIYAAPLISAFSNSMGSYSIQASNLNRMVWAEIRINYQSEDSTPPLVTGTFHDRKTTRLTTTTSEPGLLVIQLEIDKKRPMSGNVPLAIARISGSITSISPLLRYENGTTEVPGVSIINPTKEQLNEVAAEKAKNDQHDKDGLTGKSQPDVASAANVNIVAEQTVAISPSSSQPERINAPTDGAVEQPATAGSAGSGAERSTETEELPFSLSFARREGLFERFCKIKGKRSIDALAGLLSSKDEDFVQEPPLLLSDGTNLAKLTIRVLGQSKNAPQFFISGGRCVNFKAAENGVWILEIMPETGTLFASVTLLSGREAIEYPLAVVPSLELFDAGSAGPEQAEFVRSANRYILSTVTKNNPK